MKTILGRFLSRLHFPYERVQSSQEDKNGKRNPSSRQHREGDKRQLPRSGGSAHSHRGHGRRYLTCDEGRQILEEANTSREALRSTSAEALRNASTQAVQNWNKTEQQQECDLFSGRWVYDNVSYPLYEEKRCEFMSEEQGCEKYGRKDLKYQHWRWQPHGCDIPRFNAAWMLERLRNKRMVYVGDSLNRGQWVSMVCLVESSIPPHLKSVSQLHNNSLSVFKAYEYNATIEFYWEPMLVESNNDHPTNHSLMDRIVRVQAIEKHARHWSDADILIFDSFIWWEQPMFKVL